MVFGNTLASQSQISELGLPNNILIILVGAKDAGESTRQQCVVKPKIVEGEMKSGMNNK